MWPAVLKTELDRIILPCISVHILVPVTWSLCIYFVHLVFHCVGCIDLLVVRDTSRWNLVKSFIAMGDGTHVKRDEVEVYKVSEYVPSMFLCVCSFVVCVCVCVCAIGTRLLTSNSGPKTCAEFQSEAHFAFQCRNGELF